MPASPIRGPVGVRDIICFSLVHHIVALGRKSSNASQLELFAFTAVVEAMEKYMAYRSFASRAPASPLDTDLEDLEVQRTIGLTRIYPADHVDESPWGDNPQEDSPDADESWTGHLGAISSMSDGSDGRHWMTERE